MDPSVEVDLEYEVPYVRRKIILRETGSFNTIKRHRTNEENAAAILEAVE